MYKIRLKDGEAEYGFVDGTFTKEEAQALCIDMEYVFLDTDGSALDMEIVEA